MLREESPRRLAGVLGWPLIHTLSPAMHNAAFRAVGIGATYLRLPVPPQDLAGALRALVEADPLGLNVTTPHKETVARLVDDLSPDASSVMAVNTIELREGRVVGHNTDITGLVDFLVVDAALEAQGKSAVVLGAGGSARAVVRALDTLGVSPIVVCGRRSDAARSVADVAGDSTRTAGWGEAVELVSSVDVVVNATPVGANGETLLPAARFRSGQVIVDLITHPRETALVRRARRHGASAWGGVPMLVRQGADSFRIWTGRKPPLEEMLRAVGETDAENHSPPRSPDIS